MIYNFQGRDGIVGYLLGIPFSFNTQLQLDSYSIVLDNQ